jgi:dihydroorotate dehydrogenase electron transfer subunit
MARVRGELVSRERVGAYWRLRIRVPGWQPGLPGQFAMLQPEPSGFFLPRPFSLHGGRGEDVMFLVAPVGPGSEELCRLPVGGLVWVLGPLGRGFPLEEIVAHRGRVVIVAGGAGVAPFPPVLEWLQKRAARPSGADGVEAARVVGGERPELLCLLGFRDEAQAGAAAVLEQGLLALRSAGWRARSEVITEVGDRPTLGTVTDLMRGLLQPGDRVLACGPEPMCAAVWTECARVPGTGAWFSLEARMACGIGSCHGCAIPVAGGGLAVVCRQGPVFRGEDVFGSREEAR